MEETIFQPYLSTRTIFKMDREILRPSYLPDRLPHRESHIGQLAQILVTALKGERPSNVLIFGKTGTGKTAVVKYIENEFRKADGARMVQYLYLNCEIVDTPYGVLQSIGNKFIENFHQRIPFTGLSTDRVYSLLLEKLDEEKRVVIVALDEIDKLVQKNGDDILYQLLKINDDLSKARVSLIGISNELTFTEYLDPRVRSRLADEKMVFPPYNADELYDILAERSRLAFENGTATDGVLQLIAALAAQEHGDARRALDLLRVSAELVEGAPRVAVFLGREGGDQLEHAVRSRAVLEREARPLREDVVQFVRVVRREDHLLVGEAGADARIEVFREGQFVRDADQGDAGFRQVVVDLQELVQDIVAVLLNELVDLVQGDDHHALLLVEFLQEKAVHAVRREAGERDPLMEVLDELVPDRLEDAVRGVDDLAVQVEVLDHPRAVGFAELVLDVLDDGRLPRAGLSEDEHVARTLALQRGHQDLRELSDVALSMRQAVWQV